MQRLLSKWSAVGTTLLFCVSLIFTPAVLASKEGAAPAEVEITVKVSQQGFLDHRNKPFGPKNPLNIPKGKVVRITFEFSEKVTSLAYGDTHQVSIISKDGWEQESKKIWMWDQTASVTFLAGEEGRTSYRGFCIVDCIGMDHLNNLVIHVV
ncbi:hypothetical protein [Candidatus Nitronereus thalassa]|uniref:EfeO-type cupredoxin-like domain-containing protein n=1 Tax=Candidatus Nitronereus thalassa TaxID=3020898 RepID=A0ABU3K8P4_9BACT|nr:hypothetical protein [Candidatus Nitronereus thalassa]MDT7042765.1 hypothetical protein [Candidatus Nitronereus thalassa]